jgi:carboxyl-terminal processing protease
VDEYLPIGESDLPHALVWDRIGTSFFDGAPIDRRVLSRLRQESAERQTSFPEFTYLRRYISWFKEREAQKLISLNLEERKKQKEADDAFRKEIKAERDQLAKSDYPYKEFRVGPPLPPKAEVPKADALKEPEEDPDAADLEDDADVDTYGTVDVSLREALRVVDDAIELGRNRAYWASNHAPLTATAKI